MDVIANDPAAKPRWHALDMPGVLAALDAREQGLGADEVAARTSRFGANRLPEAKRTPLAVVFLRQFASPLIYLLLAASAVSLLIGALDDAGFIFVVLILNAAIGTVQEWKAEQSARALDRFIEQWVIVRRDGAQARVPAAELVPGDIVRIESGNQVPADLRLLMGLELQVDESLLTGESVAVAKDADALLPEAAQLADRANMLHAGTTVLSGRAYGVVTATGIATAIGAIAEELAGQRSPPPPLLNQLGRFSRAVGVIMMVAIVALGLAELVRGAPPAEIFFLCVALAVAAIPEGLPVAITVAPAIASARMATRHVVVRLLPAVEGLGACTLIASDKTGTLTMNALTVRRVLLSDLREAAVSGEGYSPDGAITVADAPPHEAVRRQLARLVECGLFCNEAIYRADAGEVVHFGDTVDVALQALGAKLELRREELLRRAPEVALLPFEPARRYAAAVHRVDGTTMAYVKGAAEVILPMCADGVDRTGVLAEVDRLAGAGYRVIALAAGPVPEGSELADHALTGLTFLGLTALIDPVRPEVPAAIATCRSAGISVCMVTGDHPATALAIARELELAYSPAQVMTGAELAGLPADVDPVARGTRVFARVEPAQKTDIVRRLQTAGHVVAVTGDGVNDAPALHAADIGVAMGLGGTDVARGAADLVITDDNFASIVNGIEEGRIAYANVRKVVFLLISTGIGEIVLFLLSILAGLPIPLYPVQLLWLNLVSNGIQDVALAFERGERDILRHPPRPPKERIFNRRMIEQTALAGTAIGALAFAAFYWCLSLGMSEFAARNILLLVMISFENVHVFNARSETASAFRVPFANNPFVVLAVLAAQGLHIGAMHLPLVRDILEVAPIAPRDWLTVIAFALSLIVVVEAYKWLRPVRDFVEVDHGPG